MTKQYTFNEILSKNIKDPLKKLMIIDGNMNVSGDDENLEQMAKNSIIDNITGEEAVFDLDLFTTKTSRNETNHFHIYVDDNGNYKVVDSNFVGSSAI